MSQKTLNLCLERYSFVKFGETTKSTHTVLCTNNAYSVNSDKYRLTPTAVASKHGEGYVFTLNYDFDRPLFTIAQKSYSIDGTSGNIVFEGIDPISKGSSKYLRKVTVSPVKLSDGSYLLEVTKDEYLRIGTTGAALGDEELESLNEKIVTDGGITKSVETVGGKQVLKLDAGGPSGAKEIVYFDIDPSDPPSGIYADITVALSNDKEPVIKIDGDVYFYTSTGTDKYIFVGGYNTEVVNYKTVTVSDDDSAVMETVDTIEGMVFPLYYHSENEQFTVADKTGHALTKTEIAYAYRAGQIFMFSSYPASNPQAHWGYCCDIKIESDNTGYAKFLILDAFGGDVYSWEKYCIRLLSNTEFVTLEGPNTSYTTGGSGRFADAATTVSVSGSQDFNATQKARGRNNIGAASASDVTALQSQVSSLSNVSAYSVKGEATVAQLNAGPSGIQAGWAYQLTDSGTLTDGSLAVVAGDTVAWDGTKWFPLVKSNYYATKTYAQNVAHSIAPEFDPIKPNDEGGYAYYAGERVVKDGKTWLFILDKITGSWDASYAVRTDALKLFEPKRHFSSEDFYLGYYIGGTAGNKITKTAYSSTYNQNGFAVIPVSAGETVKLKSLVDATAGSNFIVTDNDFVVVYDSGLDQTPNKEFIYNITIDGYVICNSLPSNFSFKGLFDEAEIRDRMSKSFETKVSFGGGDLEIGWVYRNDPVTKVQPSSAYRSNGCLKISVKAGEQLTIKGSPSTTDNVLIITDTSSNVLKLYPKGTLDSLTSVYIEADGFAYINSLPSTFECCHLTILAKQSISDIKNDTKYTYANLTASRTFGSRNIGFAAPAMSSSSLNRAMSIKVRKGDQLKITSKVQGSANLLYLTDANNIIKAAYTKEMVDCSIEVKYDGEALVSCENNGTFSLVHTKGEPIPFSVEKPLSRNQLPADGSSGSVFNAESVTTQDIYDALDALSAKYPYLLTSRTLGKDASGAFDVKEYVFAQRTFLAWERENYPKMYAFKNGSSVVYCDKPSPRVGDSLYSTAYIGTASLTVSSVSPNAWTLSDSNEYVRDDSADVEPTIIYTVVGEGLHLYFSNGYYRNVSATQSGNDIVYDGSTYHRNHLYDAKRGEDYEYKFCIGCAEHGPTTDPRDTAITLYNLIHDLCENASENEFLTNLRNNALIAFIPVVNPWGFDNGVNGRQNSNGVNINRNYNTPGWSSEQENPGAYPGSEIETQYAMGLFAQRNWDGSLSIHCLGAGNNDKVIMFGAKSIDPTQDIANSVAFYGVKFFANMGDLPETSCTSNAYQKLVGLSGVLIELNRGQDNGVKHTAVIETMNCTYLMLALWYLMYIRG